MVRRFKIGDQVILHGYVGEAKAHDCGKLATIVAKGCVFQWRIIINEYTTRRHLDGYDWGADEDNMTVAEGPW